MDTVLAVLVLVAAGFAAVLYIRLREARQSAEARDAANAHLGALARFVLDHAEQPIISFDGRGLIRRVNPAAEKLCGYRERELLGQSLLRLIPVSPSERGGEAEIRAKDGSLVRRKFTTARAGDPAAPDMYLFFQAQVFQAQAAAPEPAKTPPPEPEPVSETPAQPSTEDVVNRIVQQFEGLLTTISGYTELALQGTPEDSPVRKDLEEVAAASDAASNLARNLLAYSGRQTIPLETLDLNTLVGSLAAGLREAAQTPVRVELAEERTVVMAKGECLGQVLLILCRSAQHRAHNGGRVEIRTERRRLAEAEPVYTGKVPAGIYSVMTVSDSGPAIDAETLAHLFEPLFVDWETVGVELAPIHGIVRNLGGWINVISEPNAGTTFEVLFPYAGDFQVKGRAKATLAG